MVSAVNSLESAAGRPRLLQPSSEQLVQSHGTESHLWITSPFGQGGVECRDPRVPPRVAKPKTTNTIDPGGRLLSTAASARPRVRSQRRLRPRLGSRSWRLLHGLGRTPALPCRADMRLQISFRPASPEPNIVSATVEYEGLWAAHGDEIVARLEAHTGLQFAERELRAQIREGPSRSHPLQLRASYDPETKLGTLIHELAHRLIIDAAPPAARRLESHAVIYLFLFDVWTDLFGESFAQRQVEIESQRRPLYAEAWRTAHGMDRTARSARLRAVLGAPPDHR